MRSGRAGVDKKVDPRKECNRSVPDAQGGG